MRHQTKTEIAFAITLLVGGACVAQDEAPAVVPEVKGDFGFRLSFSTGVDWASAYYFRGYLQEDEGLIVQPWAELGVSVLDANDEGDFGLDVSVGIWNSFHSKHTGADDTGVDSWYEADFYASAGTTVGDFSIGAGYTVYTYPNSTFNTVQELGFTIGYDVEDGSVLEQFIGDPSLGVYFEVDNSNVSDESAAYAQLDFGPSFEVFNERATLSVPVSVGFSLDDYYVGDEDDTFGFLSVGSVLEVPIHSGDFGDITFQVGGTLMLLGETAEAVNNDDDIDGYAFVGISISR